MLDLPMALDWGREALLVTLLISAPILGAGLLVGLLISLLQTLTQLQDQTINLVPKIVAMLAAAVFFVPWLGQRIIEYTRMMLAGG